MLLVPPVPVDLGVHLRASHIVKGSFIADTGVLARSSDLPYVTERLATLRLRPCVVSG